MGDRIHCPGESKVSWSLCPKAGAVHCAHNWRKALARILDSIDSPAQLRILTVAQMQQLGEEIRREIIEKVSVKGGHLAPNLGVVELTMALHYVFDTPKDLLVWDIGHQAYVHKLLTGRRDRFHTIRYVGGLY